MKKIIYGIILGVMALAFSLPVIAGYSASLTVTEANGNSYDDLPLIESAGITYLANNGYITSTGLDTRVMSGGVALPHLLADNKILFVKDVGAYSTSNLQFTTGSTALSAFDIIVGNGGYVTIADNANLELGNDFEVELEGWLEDGMSYPCVMGGAASTQNSATNTHTVTLPGGIVSGDLLVVIFGCYYQGGSTPAITWPGTWTQLDKHEQVNWSAGVIYKVASGAEGASVTVTTSQNVWSAHQSFRVVDYQGTPEISAKTTDNTANPNSDSLTPSWGATRDTLWLSVFGGGTNAARTMSSYPTNYSYGQFAATSSGYAYAGSAQRLLAAASEDPSQYTLSGAIAWAAWTIGVKGQSLGKKPIVHKPNAFLVSVDDGDLTGRIYNGSTVTYTMADDVYEVNVWADTTDLGLDIDGSTEDSEALGGVSVPNTTYNYLLAPVYWNYYTHTTSSTLRITYEPDSIISGTTLPNETNPGTYDGVITWGTNPGGISVVLGGLVSDFQPYPSGGTGQLPPTQDIAGPTGQPGMTADVGTLATNPFYPLIEVISDNMNIPIPIVWVIVASLGVLAAMLACVRYAPHQLITAMVGGGLSAFFWHMGIYPFWVIFIFVAMAIAIIVGERSPTIS